MSKSEVKSMDRRNFFRKASLGVGAAGAAAVTLAAGKSEAAEAPKSPTASGYRATAHVKKYYELSKL